MTEVVEVPVDLLRNAAAVTAEAPGLAAERVTARLRALLDSIDRPTLLGEAPPVRDVEENYVPPMPKARTSERMRRKVWPRSGSMRLTLLRLVASSGAHGMTDYDLEDRTMRSHQSVSATRNGLVADGWLAPATYPSGVPRERMNRHGNPAQVWVATPAAIERLRHDPDA